MTYDCGQMMIVQLMKSPNHVNPFSLDSADFWRFKFLPKTGTVIRRWDMC